jgi:cytoskeleton protein RodZ
MPVESVLVPDKGVKEQTPAVASQPGIGTAIAEGGEAKRLNLLCKVKERTWMRIIADEMQPSEVMLQAGETYEVKADQVIKLKIGNAGGVDLFLNGKLLPSQGKSGEVVNLTLSENDLTQQVTR